MPSRKSMYLLECLKLSADFVVCLDREHRYTYGNQSYCDFLGLEEDGIINQKECELLDENVADRLEKARQKVVLHKNPITDTCWMKNSNGKACCVEWSFSPIEEKGRLSGIIGIGRDITRTRLKEGDNKLLRAFVENMSDAARWMDDEGRFEYVNNEWVKLTGYSKESTLGRYKWEFDSSNSKSQIQEILKTTRNLGQHVYETELLTASGGTVPVEISSRYVKLDGRGYYLSIARNITARQKKDRELARLGQIFNESQKIAKIGSWEYNSRSGECIWSDTMYTIFEMNEAEEGSCPDRFMQKVHSDDIGILKSIFQSSYLHSLNREVEFRIVMEDGKIKILKSSFQADIDEDGVYKLIGTIQDVTQLKEQENLISSVFNMTEMGICMTDIQGDIIQVNQKFCDMHGYRKEELVGKRFFELLKEENRAIHWKKYYEYMHENYEIPALEIDVQKKSGEIFSVLLTSSKIYNDKGELLSIMTLTDISQQRRIEERQQQQEQMLIQQSKMASMGEMIGAIAHQWRQPLSTITLLAGNLVHAHTLERLDEKLLGNATKTIIDNARYMSEAIDTFKKFYQMDTEKKVFDVVNAVETVIYILKPQMAVNFITVTLHDKTKGAAFCYGFENIFKQAVTNLLLNSRDAITEKFGVEGEFEGVIDIYFEVLENEVHVRVCDNGMGIHNNMRDKIFLPYKTSKGVGGTGIGLYITKLIIEEKMEGRISVSGFADPTEFTLILPKVENE